MTTSPKGRISVVTFIGVLCLTLGLGALGYIGWEYRGTNITSRQAFTTNADDLRREWGETPDGRREGDVDVPGASASLPAGGGSTSRPDRASAADPATPAPGTLPEERLRPRPTSGERADESRAPYAGKAIGQNIALLRIPRFGRSYQVPILEGTDLRHLNRGVGHYQGTAEAGTVGNFALAGHRVTHGEPFARLLELRPGDLVVVETRDKVFTYRMDTSPRDLTVTDTEGSWVLDPVPGKPDERPTRATITLTTCQDLFHSADRSVGFGTLIEERVKA